MNREIKFRAWDGKRMTTSGIMFNNSNGCIELPKTINDPTMILMQYTGLKDKDGVDIFEGDIVKCHYLYAALGENLGVFEAEKEIIGEMSFQEMGLWIQCNTEDDSGYLLWINGLHEESFEVIGNVFENPELIK